MIRLGPPVVVVQADDVVFAEVVAVLDLDEHQGNLARVVDPVRRAGRHIDGVTALHVGAVTVEGDDPGPAHHEPVLRTPCVPLVAEALPGPDLDCLDLEIRALREDGIGAPRAVSMISHPAILPDEPVFA